ncbi:hypothetical protein [Vibrio bivalvicida]|uniref:Uncharacterized protein n=1 Tax=Vibrio bivalvicida TaxID=1276888 RepID=A0A177Y0U9_9VIBR|nr:hypothetical protein [Vibrio bivalvicida]OAJ94451.1 hypothetical protein APB76_09735 [Vibrio bivalvicida]
MSRRNAVKIKTLLSESSGYHFKSSSDESSYVIGSKHGFCNKVDDCQPYNDGEPDCCRVCDVQLDISTISLYKKSNQKLTPLRVYSFPKHDIAVIEVEELSTTPIKIGTLEESKGEYVATGYKSDSDCPSRLLLNNPELEGDECYFNVESNVVAELVEKSEELVGMSGSLVVSKLNSDIPIAYSVITTNEEANDVLGELLQLVNFEPMNDFFGSKIIHKQRCKINIDTKFKDHFKVLSTITVCDNLDLTVLIPVKKGFPHFNLNPIASSLISEFETILGHNSENKSMLTVSALRVLEQKRELQPAYKLLTSRLVESMLNAPHIYSTYIDHMHYHHVHLLNDSEAGAEFLVSSFGGEGASETDLDTTLEHILHRVNSYAYNPSLISERAFLDVKYSEEECEALYEVLFGENDDFIRNISIMYCINLQYLFASPDLEVEKQIEQFVEKAGKNINKSTLQQIENRLNVNLYVLPTNKCNELTELVEGLLK